MLLNFVISIVEISNAISHFFLFQICITIWQSSFFCFGKQYFLSCFAFPDLFQFGVRWSNFVYSSEHLLYRCKWSCFGGVNTQPREFTSNFIAYSFSRFNIRSNWIPTFWTMLFFIWFPFKAKSVAKIAQQSLNSKSFTPVKIGNTLEMSTLAGICSRFYHRCAQNRFNLLELHVFEITKFHCGFFSVFSS